MTNNTKSVKVAEKTEIIERLREISAIVFKQPDALTEHDVVCKYLSESLQLLGAKPAPHSKELDAASSIWWHAKECVEKNIDPDPSGYLDSTYHELTGNSLLERGASD